MLALFLGLLFLEERDFIVNLKILITGDHGTHLILLGLFAAALIRRLRRVMG